ncbi:hypothetical protein LCGC14_1524330 [marine sediment metagenome]|uniref:Uncharacterized protein n=1 Tax=marine sediment metagenome TaxID=412755 RepID=A0A0F9LYN5_9ZZZZ
MAVFHGKTAKVSFSASVEAITGWSLAASADVAESTVMQSSGWWQGFEGGFFDATATVDGNGRTTRDTIAQIGAEAALQLYLDATNYFGFNAICTGITETASKDDIGKISYSFEMDDAAGMVYT